MEYLNYFLPLPEFDPIDCIPQPGSSHVSNQIQDLIDQLKKTIADHPQINELSKKIKNKVESSIEIIENYLEFEKFKKISNLISDGLFNTGTNSTDLFNFKNPQLNHKRVQLVAVICWWWVYAYGIIKFLDLFLSSGTKQMIFKFYKMLYDFESSKIPSLIGIFSIFKPSRLIELIGYTLRMIKKTPLLIFRVFLFCLSFINSAIFICWIHFIKKSDRGHIFSISACNRKKEPLVVEDTAIVQSPAILAYFAIKYFPNATRLITFNFLDIAYDMVNWQFEDTGFLIFIMWLFGMAVYYLISFLNNASNETLEDITNRGSTIYDKLNSQWRVYGVAKLFVMTYFRLLPFYCTKIFFEIFLVDILNLTIKYFNTNVFLPDFVDLLKDILSNDMTHLIVAEYLFNMWVCRCFEKAEQLFRWNDTYFQFGTIILKDNYRIAAAATVAYRLFFFILTFLNFLNFNRGCQIDNGSVKTFKIKNWVYHIKLLYFKIVQKPYDGDKKPFKKILSRTYAYIQSEYFGGAIAAKAYNISRYHRELAFVADQILAVLYKFDGDTSKTANFICNNMPEVSANINNGTLWVLNIFLNNLSEIKLATNLKNLMLYGENTQRLNFEKLVYNDSKKYDFAQLDLTARFNIASYFNRGVYRQIVKNKNYFPIYWLLSTPFTAIFYTTFALLPGNIKKLYDMKIFKRWLLLIEFLISSSIMCGIGYRMYRAGLEIDAAKKFSLQPNYVWLEGVITHNKIENNNITLDYEVFTMRPIFVQIILFFEIIIVSFHFASSVQEIPAILINFPEIFVLAIFTLITMYMHIKLNSKYALLYPVAGVLLAYPSFLKFFSNSVYNTGGICLIFGGALILVYYCVLWPTSTLIQILIALFGMALKVLMSILTEFYIGDFFSFLFGFINSIFSFFMPFSKRSSGHMMFIVAAISLNIYSYKVSYNTVKEICQASEEFDSFLNTDEKLQPGLHVYIKNILLKDVDVEEILTFPGALLKLPVVTDNTINEFFRGDKPPMDNNNCLNYQENKDYNNYHSGVRWHLRALERMDDTKHYWKERDFMNDKTCQKRNDALTHDIDFSFSDYSYKNYRDICMTSNSNTTQMQKIERDYSSNLYLITKLEDNKYGINKHVLKSLDPLEKRKKIFKFFGNLMFHKRRGMNFQIIRNKDSTFEIKPRNMFSIFSGIGILEFCYLSLTGGLELIKFFKRRIG